MMDTDERLMFRCYLALRVLHTMTAKKGLSAGAHEAQDIMRDIERKYPLFPVKACLR